MIRPPCRPSDHGSGGHKDDCEVFCACVARKSFPAHDVVSRMALPHDLTSPYIVTAADAGLFQQCTANEVGMDRKAAKTGHSLQWCQP